MKNITLKDLKEPSEYTQEEMKLIELGRLSVLRDFDSMSQADAFVGFTSEEWKAIKKFFAFNKALSQWDK